MARTSRTMMALQRSVPPNLSPTARLSGRERPRDDLLWLGAQAARDDRCMFVLCRFLVSPNADLRTPKEKALRHRPPCPDTHEDKASRDRKACACPYIPPG